MKAIPEKYLDLFTTAVAFGHLATVMPDGTPQCTPVWFDMKDGLVRVNSVRGRVKARNMEVGAAVALSVQDPQRPYRYVQVRGRVKSITEQGAEEHANLLTKKYLGKDKYPFGQPGEVRAIFAIEPFSVQAMG